MSQNWKKRSFLRQNDLKYNFQFCFWAIFALFRLKISYFLLAEFRPQLRINKTLKRA